MPTGAGSCHSTEATKITNHGKTAVSLLLFRHGEGFARTRPCCPSAIFWLLDVFYSSFLRSAVDWTSLALSEVGGGTIDMPLLRFSIGLVGEGQQSSPVVPPGTRGPPGVVPLEEPRFPTGSPCCGLETDPDRGLGFP